MYGFAPGVAPSRDVAGSMQNATEQPGSMPFPMQQDEKRKKLAMLMMQQQMQGIAPPPMAQTQQPFDIFGA